MDEEQKALKPLLSPRSDWLFKKLFSEKKMEKGLMSFLSGFTGQAISSVTIKNPILPVDFSEEKAVRLDLKCVTDNGTQIDVEMQAYRMTETDKENQPNLKGRATHYLTKLHSSQESKGKEFDSQVQSFQIMICTHTVFEDRENFLNTFTMRNEEGDILNNLLNITFVELNKLKPILDKPVSEMTIIEKWSIFLQYVDKPTYTPIVKHIAQADGGIQVGIDTLSLVSQDDHNRAMMVAREEFLADVESNRLTSIRKALADKQPEIRAEGRAEGLAEGRAEGLAEGEAKGLAKGLAEGEAKGLAEGLAEGEAKTRAETVLHMRKKGFSDESIAEATNYPLEVVKKI
jgi:predicted transposase/invertase (TIGR01784 family)